MEPRSISILAQTLACCLRVLLEFHGVNSEVRCTTPLRRHGNVELQRNARHALWSVEFDHGSAVLALQNGLQNHEERLGH